MTKTEEFVAEYNKVFDDKNTVKACGRGECKKLIELANEIEPNVYCGNSETGMMYVENMKLLYERAIGE